MAYATVNDYEAIYGISLSASDSDRVETLLDSASSMLNVELKKRGKTASYINDDEDLTEVAKLVVCASVNRIMKKNSSAGADLSQYSQSALGYTVSGTFLNPGDDLYFLTNELKRLGLKRQRIGVIEPYGNSWYPGDPDQ